MEAATTPACFAHRLELPGEIPAGMSARSTVAPFSCPPRRVIDNGFSPGLSAKSLHADSQSQVRACASGAGSRPSSKVALTVASRGRTTRDIFEARRHQSASVCSFAGLSVPEASAPRSRRTARVLARTSSARPRSAATSFGGIVRLRAAARRSSAPAIPPSSCASTEQTASFSSAPSAERAQAFASILAKTYLTSEVTVAG